MICIQKQFYCSTRFLVYDWLQNLILILIEFVIRFWDIYYLYTCIESNLILTSCGDTVAFVFEISNGLYWDKQSFVFKTILLCY